MTPFLMNLAQFIAYILFWKWKFSFKAHSFRYFGAAILNRKNPFGILHTIINQCTKSHTFRPEMAVTWVLMPNTTNGTTVSRDQNFAYAMCVQNFKTFLVDWRRLRALSKVIFKQTLFDVFFILCFEATPNNFRCNYGRGFLNKNLSFKTKKKCMF